MSRKSIRVDTLKQVVSDANQVFTTKDISEDERMRHAHAELVAHSHYHAFVGGALSDHRVVLGIIETQKGTTRGSRWAKQSGSTGPATDAGPSASTSSKPFNDAQGLRQMSAEEKKNSGLIVLMLFAQAYYKMLESVISMARWVTAIDVALNDSYPRQTRNGTRAQTVSSHRMTSSNLAAFRTEAPALHGMRPDNRSATTISLRPSSPAGR